MSVELYTEHLKGFTFMEMRTFPDRNDGVYCRVLAGQLCFQRYNEFSNFGFCIGAYEIQDFYFLLGWKIYTGDPFDMVETQFVSDAVFFLFNDWTEPGGSER